MEQTDISQRGGGCGDWKKLAKEHIRTAYGYRQQCGKGQGRGGGWYRVGGGKAWENGTSVVLSAIFKKHVITDCLVRGTNLFFFRLSNKKMTTANTIAI